MKTARPALALVVCLIALPIYADDAVYQSSKEIRFRPAQQEELTAVSLDPDVFAATRNDLFDIRLLDDAGNAIPYLLRKAPTTRAQVERTAWQGGAPSLRPLPGDGLEITVRLEKDPQPNGLSIISPLSNFEQRVRVFSSDDGQHWQPAGSEATLFDFSRYMDVRNDSVSFPETGRRHFRVVIDAVTSEQKSELVELTRRLRGKQETDREERVVIDQRPFRIDHIQFWRDVERQQATGDEKVKYAVAGFRVEQLPKSQQTIITVDTRREPLISLELKTADRNFSRHAAVEVKHVDGVTTAWRPIGEGTLSRVDFNTLKREHLSISFAESRQSEYRIVIDNRDSPPLQVAGVEAEGHSDELVFLAEPQRQYRLVYDARDAQTASYDTAAIQELLGAGFRPVRAELGRQTAGPGAGRVPGFDWSTLLNHRGLLGGVISILVIVLAWGLYQAAKRIEAPPSE